MKTQVAKTVPKILPREPLTNKARKAVHKYVELNSEKVMRLQYFMIDLVLKAERMRRSDLYQWLEKRGYYWNSRGGGYWLQQKREDHAGIGGV